MDNQNRKYVDEVKDERREKLQEQSSAEANLEAAKAERSERVNELADDLTRQKFLAENKASEYNKAVNDYN